jgi:uncharacterized protein
MDESQHRPSGAGPSPGMLTRRGFLAAAGLSTAGLVFYSGEIARHEIEIVHRTVHIANLPAAFHGLRIAQLSDIHYDHFSEPGFVRRAVQHINTLAPDLVLFTGDYVSKAPGMSTLGPQHAHLCAEILKEVACPERYAVLGNHDVSVGAAMVTEALVTNGIPVLADTWHPLERDGQRLWIVGLQDASLPILLPDLQAAMPPALANEPILLMVHEPDYTDKILASPLGAHIDLVLSGHSHGGQICAPLVGPVFLPKLGQKYVSGLFRFPAAGNGKTVQLYVNRGLGTVGLPLRLNCPPEITLLTLSAEPV